MSAGVAGVSLPGAAGAVCATAHAVEMKSCAGVCVSSRALRPNHVWTYDFVFDRCANGQKLKILTVVDEYTRESLAVETATSIRSDKVLDVLAALIRARGVPEHLRSDNGPEFVAARVKQW